MPTIPVPEMVDLLVKYHPVTEDGESLNHIANERRWTTFLLNAFIGEKLLFRNVTGAKWPTRDKSLADIVPERFAEGYVSKGDVLRWLTPILSNGDVAVLAESFGATATPIQAVQDAPATEAGQVAPVVAGPEPRPAATGPQFTMTKTAMIEQHKHEWKTIAQDIKDAGRNGLSAAKAGAREWREADAMEWARAKGRLKSIDKTGNALAGANSIFNSPTSHKTGWKG